MPLHDLEKANLVDNQAIADLIARLANQALDKMAILRRNRATAIGFYIKVVEDALNKFLNYCFSDLLNQIHLKFSVKDNFSPQAVEAIKEWFSKQILSYRLYFLGNSVLAESRSLICAIRRGEVTKDNYCSTFIHICNKLLAQIQPIFSWHLSSLASRLDYLTNLENTEVKK